MAKKAESTLKNMLLSLTLIALVASLALALVNRMTKGPIEEVNKKKTAEAVEKVLSIPDPADASKMVKIYENYTVDTVEFTDTIKGKPNTFTLTRYTATDAEGKMVGKAVESYSDAGFGGRLKAMVGFDAEGNILGYDILESSETPGLGAKADQWFQRDGKGNVIGKNMNEKPLGVTKGGEGDVDAITGSTITSRAFCGLVNTAYKAYLIEKGGDKQ